MELLQTIETLCGAVGVSGQEHSAAAAALNLLKEYAPNAEIDPFHNVYGVVRLAKEGQPAVVLDAHIDEIGMIVTYVDTHGFLKVSACGGVDRRLVLGQEVIVHGRQELHGVVAAMPPHLTAGDDSGKVSEIEQILIDVGLTRDEVKKVVALGDRVTIKSGFHSLLGSRIASKSLDDRSCVAVILRTLELLKGQDLSCGLSVMFSAQEETGERGAMIAGYQLKPDIAVALDVSFAHTPDADETKCGKMGAGPMIGMAPTLDRELSQRFVTLAQQNQIPYQTEVMGGATGTNADAIGVLRGGVRMGLLSVPLKYMHTPIEMVDLSDCEATARLLAAFLSEIGKGE
ncbi:Putative aminopeptidase ysdC [uncultured Ruminococcus sp.]|uniref:M20/M25/M40 family metallo-hydrolase n=1 Tax=Massiliimalia timonensis TaxID=1987501 RepID=A0A8J6PGN8_9FIRM|nr:M20/M25/M40 family metallo-hydrolase [Massiliimalia timonensis]MBC8609935.1 M20/M25/M40 family metallo-hydrolase [Massiliimalia timonensis]MBS7175770.1 M20/M25/M40 family metallo-hydrolase [Clostridiales bacterium]SCH18306.1 Putative aminopeptidase ysdC [uncultured Ruminococcus sp.]SCH24521.1 Putative aminopeptidase ysdC [uncultured Clostridium sp.]